MLLPDLGVAGNNSSICWIFVDPLDVMSGEGSGVSTHVMPSPFNIDFWVAVPAAARRKRQRKIFSLGFGCALRGPDSLARGTKDTANHNSFLRAYLGSIRCPNSLWNRSRVELRRNGFELCHTRAVAYPDVFFVIWEYCTCWIHTKELNITPKSDHQGPQKFKK